MTTLQVSTDKALHADARAITDRLGHLIRLAQFRDRDRACCHGLSVTQCYALDAIIRTGGLGVNGLAAELLLDKSTTSRVARALREKGLVRRAPDPDDGRAIRLVATAEGRDVHDRIESRLLADHADLIRDLTPEARSAVVEVLGRLAHAFARRVRAEGGTCCVIDPQR